MAPVPRTHQVIPGALVNIVLKADQRTGRQVQGIVQHVLTKGDHPRGIKVRLTDSRVGRVQSMALVESSSSTYSPSSPTSTDNPSSSPPMVTALANTGGPRGQGRRPRYRDARLEEPLDAAPEQIDLGAYVVPSRRKERGKKRNNANQADDAANSDGPNSNNTEADVTSALAKCPVCGAFEGDETAVAHHVAGHFGS
ncbi:hypothetical protein GGR58DRAFT_432971 [Xylaria digitata]|nr:hypothetical protein GGR58DRAFT_432971 [Xylaria digitata]